MKFVHTKLILLAAAVSTAAIASFAPALADDAPRSQESPWAMRAPASPDAGGATPAPAAAAASPAAAATSAAAPSAAAMPAAAASPVASPAAKPTVAVLDVTEVKITPDQRKFADRLIKVVNDQDIPGFKQMLAPKALACLQTDDKKEFFAAWIKKQVKYAIPDTYKLKIGRLPIGLSDNSKYNTYPLQATHILEIEYEARGGGATVTFNRMIAQDGGKWYQTAPCPTAMGLERWNKMEQMKAARRERSRQVFAQLRDPVKSQLKDLIAKGNRAQAWKLCMRTQHVDMLVAQQVIEQLAGDETDPGKPSTAH